MRGIYWPSRFCGAGLLLLSAACTPTTITSQIATPAPTDLQSFHVVSVGAVDASDPQFAYLGAPFRQAFADKLRELRAFDTVNDNPATPPDPGAFVVTATLTEIGKGNAAVRLLIGFGAGHEYVTAHLVIKNADGNTVGAFDVHKVYAGGVGIGGASFVDIDDLVKKVGAQSAVSLVDWSRGKLTAAAN
jgi:hypothetical protein